MNRVQLENEARFLERVELYRQEYRTGRMAAVHEERERRRENDEVYFAGTWVPRLEAGRIARRFQRREILAFFEIVVLLILLLGLAAGLSWLFALLFLP